MADGSASLRSSQGPWRREINLRQFSARSWLSCKEGEGEEGKGRKDRGQRRREDEREGAREGERESEGEREGGREKEGEGGSRGKSFMYIVCNLSNPDTLGQKCPD